MQHASESIIGVVVVNYGSTALLKHNLAGLIGAPNCRVVVVDNFSGEVERDRVAELCRDNGWISVLLDNNAGFGAGVNAGLAAARRVGADAYLLINPDAEIDAATLSALHDHVREHPLDLVAPKITRPDGANWSQGFGVDLRSGRMRSRPGLLNLTPAEAPWLTGTCLALSSELLDRIEGMPDGYFLYWEDVDFSMRVRRAGGRLSVRNDLTAIHDEGGTQRDTRSRTRPLSNRYYYYNCRNRLLFATNHLGRRARWSWMLRTPRQSWLILLRGGRRQLIRSPDSLGAAVAGSVVGLSIAARSMITTSRVADIPH